MLDLVEGVKIDTGGEGLGEESRFLTLVEDGFSGESPEPFSVLVNSGVVDARVIDEIACVVSVKDVKLWGSSLGTAVEHLTLVKGNNEFSSGVSLLEASVSSSLGDFSGLEEIIFGELLLVEDLDSTFRVEGV